MSTAPVEEQLTTEGKLLCAGIVIAGLFEAGRVRASDPADQEAESALSNAVEAMQAFRAEVNAWPDATH